MHDIVSFQASEQLAQEVSASQKRSLGTETANIFACFARKGGYAGNWTWANKSTTKRAVESFVKRGLAVPVVETNYDTERTVFRLRPDLQARLLEIEAGVLAARRAQEEAEQAQRDAKEAARRFILVLVNLHTGAARSSAYSIYTGPGGHDRAKAHVEDWKTTPAGRAGSEMMTIIELPPVG